MNVHTIDLQFQSVPQTIAAYLVVGPEGPVLVETGPMSTLPVLRQALAQLGYEPADIHHVLVTHIHLDHAGAAGWWAQQGAQVYVHYFGAKHLIDPSRLWSSALRIYGDRMVPLWGSMEPAPAEKVTAVSDNDTIHAAGLTFTALETPGHARHHHVWQLTDIAFTGDAAGIRLPDTTFIDMPAPPPEFDRETWLETLDRIAAHNFRAIYPTHFGRLDDPPQQLDGLRSLMDEATQFVRRQLAADVPRDDMVSNYREWITARARAAGLSDTAVHQYETANPWYMSVDGMRRYWQNRAA